MNMSIENFVDKVYDAVEKKVSKAISKSMDIVSDHWKNEANSHLKTTSEAYRSAILPPVMTSPTSGEIELSGSFPNMLEEGTPSFDMKPGFAASHKRKLTKDKKGWYLTIPLSSKDQYGVATKATNPNFKRVSNNSSPASWIHPGLPGVHLIPGVVSFAIKTLENQLNRELRGR